MRLIRLVNLWQKGNVEELSCRPESKGHSAHCAAGVSACSIVVAIGYYCGSMNVIARHVEMQQKGVRWR